MTGNTKLLRLLFLVLPVVAGAWISRPVQFRQRRVATDGLIVIWVLPDKPAVHAG